MKIQPWPRIKRKTLLTTKIFVAHCDRLQSPRDGHQSDFFVIEAPDWINIIALTKEHKILLVRQYRHGTGEITFEIPGGMVEPGETTLQAAKRELREETGYTAQTWEQLGVVEPNPAFQTNRTITYLAHQARQTGMQQPDENEHIEVLEEDLDEITKMLRDGKIKHSLVLCAFAHYALQKGIGLSNHG